MNIKDIAKELGISQSTVSKAINNRKDVGEDVKNRVKEYIEKVGYTPNPLGRRLAINKTNTIGVFIVSRDIMKLNDNFAVEFLDGIAKKAYEINYDLLLFTTVFNKNNKNGYMKLCEERKVEGAIFIGLSLNDTNLESIKNSKIPVAVIDIFLYGKNVFSVRTNNKKGIESALKYCFEKGHKEIGFIKACDGAEVAVERFENFKEIMQKNKLYNENYIVEGDFSKESGYNAANKLIKNKKLPTIIISSNDLMALGAIKAFKENGIKVPEDISVIGYDNITAGEYSEPELTTVGQDAIKIGAEAVEYIIGNRKAGLKLINPFFIERKSVLSNYEKIGRNKK